MALITKIKHGRKNIYELREKIQIKTNNSDEIAAMATWRYIPMALKKATEELKQVILTDPTLTSIENGQVTIHNLNIQIINQIGQNNTQNISIKGSEVIPNLSTDPK